MSTAYFQFLGRLRDFLRQGQKDGAIVVQFRGAQSIKHLMESLGVPHPEVGQVRVNGQEGTWAAITKDDDHIQIYPILDGCSIPPRFVLDGHLGRLTAHLRMLGFDCLYRNNYDDGELAEIAASEGRILLSRDRRLLMRKAVTFGYCLRALEPLEQLTEAIQRFDLISRIAPFHRCLRCNHLLQPVSKETVLDRLEPLTNRYFNEFHICPACGQIYWKGSHYERMQGLIDQLKNAKPGK